MQQDIAGTIVFDGTQAQKGLALNRKRAGFINKAFDTLCLDKIIAEPDALTRYSIHDWVEQSGSQGVEFLNWMAMRGALTGRVSELSRNYHIPISNTAAATVVYDNQNEVARKVA
jgi:protocatechuate 4,5-dioxygenase, beta chain